MSNTGKGDSTEGTVVEFDTLESDEGKDTQGSERLGQLATYLKEHLDPDQYGAAMKILGVKTEMTNEELLEEFQKIFLAAKEEDEYEYPDEKTKKGAAPNYKDFMKQCMSKGKSLTECAAEYKKKQPAPSEEEEAAVLALIEDGYKYPDEKTIKGAAPSYKDFMKQCTKSGKSTTECAAEFKKKYPAPSKEEEAAFLATIAKPGDGDEPTAELTKELREQTRVVAELTADIKRLKDERRLAEIDHKVDEQITAKHLAPVQKEQVIKLMAKLPDEFHEEFLGTFGTQKFKGFEDVGKTDVRKPGEPEKIDDETRKRIMTSHGLEGLIDERGFKARRDN